MEKKAVSLFERRSLMVPMRFELKRKDTSLSLRLPEELLEFDVRQA